VHTIFWWGDLIERDYLEYQRQYGDNIKIDLKEVGWGAWTGLT